MSANGKKIDTPLLQAVAEIIKAERVKNAVGSHRVEIAGIPGQVVEIPAPVIPPADMAPVALAIEQSLGGVNSSIKMALAGVEKSIEKAIGGVKSSIEKSIGGVKLAVDDRRSDGVVAAAIDRMGTTFLRALAAQTEALGLIVGKQQDMLNRLMDGQAALMELIAAKQAEKKPPRTAVIEHKDGSKSTVTIKDAK